jgi:hypothetical protein
MPANTYDVTVVDGPQCGVIVEVCPSANGPTVPSRSATGAYGWRSVRSWTTPMTMAAKTARALVPCGVG